jgi:tetratricopeptide (TPR) repeat protein
VSNDSSRSEAGGEGPPVGATLHSLVRQGRAFSGHERNCFFLNTGRGKFADASSPSGFDFPDDGRSIGLCDWDFDGDLDVWLANRNGPQVRFLRNDLVTGHHFLALRLEGTTCNRDAIGARVEVVLDDDRGTRLIRTLRAGEGFLSQSSKWLHFGLGTAEQLRQVTVRWPDGKSSDLGKLTVDHHYLVAQGATQVRTWNPPQRARPLPPAPLVVPSSQDNSRIVSASQLPLPPLEYETFEGSRQRVEQGSQPLLINLWASWCRPCLAELKEFSEHAHRIDDAGLQIVALSVDPLDASRKIDSAESPAVLKRLGYGGIAGWATESTVHKLQLVQDHLFDTHQPTPVPTSLLVDATGKLAVLYRGPVAVDQLLADVARLGTPRVAAEELPFEGRWHTRRQGLSPHDLAWQLVEQGYLTDAMDYLRQYQALFESHYNLPKLLVLIGNGQLVAGDAKSALSYYRAALKRDVGYGEARNNLAWVLSTHPDATVRDGKLALELAISAVQAGQGNAASLLDTLAAAYAENQQFEQAVRIATKAVEVAKANQEHERAARIETRLRSYESASPWRDQ